MVVWCYWTPFKLLSSSYSFVFFLHFFPHSLQLPVCRVLLSGRGLSPEREAPLSVSAPIGGSTVVSIPFTNPMELPVELAVSITGPPPPLPLYHNCHQLTMSALQSGDDPSGDASARPVGTEKEEKEEGEVFSVCLIPAKGTFPRSKFASDEMFSKPVLPHAITSELKNNGLAAK